MPFVNSYLDVEKKKPDDAREYLRDLAARIVQEPVATHIVETKTRTGKTRFLVIDRSLIAQPGDLIVYATDTRLTVRRLTPDMPPERIWGAVAWFIEQG